MQINLLKKFLSFSYGGIIGAFIGVFITMISTRILTPEEYGKVSMFTVAQTVLMIIVMMGTDQSFIRFFYEEDEDKRGKLLFNCIKTPLIVFILVAVILLIFHESFSLFLFGESSFSLIFLLIAGVFAQLIQRYSSLVIRMQQHGRLFSNIEILKRGSQLLFIIILSFSIEANFEIVVCSTVFSLYISAIVAIKKENRFWSTDNIDIKNTKHSSTEIISFGIPLLFTNLVTWIFQSFDRIAIKEWSNYDELGLYSAAFKIAALLTIIQVAFSTFWTPVSYEQFEKNPENKEFFAKATKIISMGMFLTAILTIIFKDIIIILLGPDFSAASTMLPFLIFTPLLYTISETTVIGINFYKKTKWHIFLAIVSCIVNILINYLLVPKYGGLGAAIANSITYIVFFTLRTMISLIYYKVQFGLVKIYSMILVIMLLSFISIIVENTYINIFSQSMALSLCIIIYFQEIKTITKMFIKNGY